jgi:protein-tyrosine phosphatase
VRFGFYDSALSVEDLPRILRIARRTRRAWKLGQRVLIRCQAGVNRSGLISALVLMLEGYTAADAIALLRERRSAHVLSNRHFEEWLLTSAGEYLEQTPSSSNTRVA